METKFVCPVCGNDNESMIGYLNGKPYCRKCIKFQGEEAPNSFKIPAKARYKLNYSLSNDQLRLSNSLIENYKKGINTLVHAVCGSGKTEIVLEVIKYAVECGDRVGFAVPRRDVVIELYDRFHEIFKFNKVVMVYGGHTERLEGDLVCLTTHQLYRYKDYFDLLILDEVDAFPFKGSDILETFFNKSIKGKYIMMSATPDEELLNKFSREGMCILELFSRFHEHPLPVPEIKKSNILGIFLILKNELKRFLNKGKQVFVFAPTIDECESVFFYLKLFFKNGAFVHSKNPNRSQIISDFKSKKYQFLVTTAVLERGVTVKDLQVIVFKADHSIYNRYSLVQIAGRVGRKADAPEGEVIFIVQDININVREAREDIITANKNLQNLF